jgi:lipopolysaccharide transport protein LptA
VEKKMKITILSVLAAAFTAISFTVFGAESAEAAGKSGSSEKGATALEAGEQDKAVAGRKRKAKITSRSTYYDRKEGIGVFSGDVYVDDEDYQMHADKVYLFVKGTNELERIVAIGNVAMTNGTKRAYGAKVSYYRDPGLVVLYSGDGISAEVRDVAKEGDQVVRGKKIRFWTDAEQVEVLEAEITAPSESASGGGLKKVLGQ